MVVQDFGIKGAQNETQDVFNITNMDTDINSRFKPYFYLYNPCLSQVTPTVFHHWFGKRL